MATNYRYNALTVTDLLAALPGLLGYVPNDQLVAVTMHRPKRRGELIRNALAVELATPQADILATLARSADINITNTSGAYLIAVCDLAKRPQAHLALDAALYSIASADVPVYRRILATTVATAGGTWFDVDTGAVGTTVDYQDSPMTAFAIMGGRVIAPTRDQAAAK
jgi:hypothetical protein